jgi:pyridoxine kinase
MFKKFTFCDLTSEIQPISDAFKENDIDFDAIYTGYLGSFDQLALVEKLFDDYKKEGSLYLIDPVMADNGSLYKGFTPEFAAAMAKLCGKADVIVPNLTEASFMLGIPYTPEYDEAYIRDVLKRLCGLGCKRAALTGVSFSPDKIGVYYYDSEKDSYFSYFNERLPVSFHGTGDIYASSALGAMMRGIPIERSFAIAVDFTLRCMKETMADENHRFYGVNFESALPYYIQLIEQELKNAEKL